MRIQLPPGGSIAATFLALAATLSAQSGPGGPLIPPAAPDDGVYKTLDQVEPRTPLVADSDGVSVAASGTITISQSGSYYLTDNLTVTGGNGITIDASGVTLDLAGFQISTTASAGTGVQINDSNIAVHNGHIVGGVTYDSGAEGDQFTGSGFTDGINDASSTTNIHIREISVKGCDNHGISLSLALGLGKLVEFCTVHTVGDRGIRAEIVRNCTVHQCGGVGVFATAVTSCVAQSVADSGIIGETVTGSSGVSSSTDLFSGVFPMHDGISADRSVSNSYGRSATGNGIDCNGNVSNSYGVTTETSTGAHGILAASSVSNSYGESAGGSGIWSSGNVSNSYGETTEDSMDVDGIRAFFNVSDSVGKSAGGDGISSSGNVSNSHGVTTGTSTGAVGIRAGRSVSNSYGESAGDHGISSSGNVSNSYGKTTGTSTSADGITTSGGNVSNSSGVSAEGDGISAVVGTVSFSRGVTSGSGISADGLACEIAIGCNSFGGENITHKYLMP